MQFLYVCVREPHGAPMLEPNLAGESDPISRGHVQFIAAATYRSPPSIA